MDDPFIAVIWLGDESASTGFTICPLTTNPANNTLSYQVKDIILISVATYNGVKKEMYDGNYWKYME